MKVAPELYVPPTVPPERNFRFLWKRWVGPETRPEISLFPDRICSLDLPALMLPKSVRISLRVNFYAFKAFYSFWGNFTYFYLISSCDEAELLYWKRIPVCECILRPSQSQISHWDSSLTHTADISRKQPDSHCRHIETAAWLTLQTYRDSSLTHTADISRQQPDSHCRHLHSTVLRHRATANRSLCSQTDISGFDSKRALCCCHLHRTTRAVLTITFICCNMCMTGSLHISLNEITALDLLGFPYILVLVDRFIVCMCWCT
jgi:hypothetical protein